MHTSKSLIARAALSIALAATLIANAMAQNLALELVADGLTAPIHLEEPGDGSGRKFIVQQDGVVRALASSPMSKPPPVATCRNS